MGRSMKKRRRPNKNGKGSKRLAERKHSTLRAWQRYGVPITKELRTQIKDAIRNKASGAIFVEKQSNRVSVWKVTIPDYPVMVVVYDTNRKEIVTFLPNPKNTKALT